MRVITTLISMLLISLLSFPVMTFAAESPIHLFMNGKQLAAEVPPRIVKGNTLVPIRIIAETLGSKVQWEEKSRKVTVVKDDVTIQLYIDKNEAVVNNKKTQLEAAPQLTDGNTLLPVRFVSEQLGVKVTWDELTRSVFLYQQEKEASNTNDKPAAEVTDSPKDTGNQPEAAVATIKSISLDGDVLSVQTNGQQKPEVNVTPAANTNQIIIDLPNSKLDPALKLNSKGEGVVKENNEKVSQIRYLLFSKESSIVRIIIDSSQKLDLKPTSVKPSSDSTLLAWKLTAKQDKFKVVIDPGHGGKDTGAVSVTKRYEKDFVLSLGMKVYKLLEQEPRIDPQMTRDTDDFIELSGRTAFANEMKADLFVSIHGNSAGKESISGTETYYYTEQSLDFANIMHDVLIPATGFTDRKVKQNNFYVIKNTTMPSLLLEIGFLSNRSDEEAMYQEQFQNRVAASIVAGIKKQLNID
ncbi:N-acetylmuramoyl-L-alanine amidase [Paenibacillus rigui]|uniref:N-acetylmuramoyl-L-alanine amidase n=2 Tax=Paenibacillus rigui TaxID=554312 RepID=A0A229UX68_9BACL|nr:N-acetylmuramoyl-L-alanine amidase [Paenibacillus rigui]